MSEVPLQENTPQDATSGASEAETGTPAEIGTPTLGGDRPSKSETLDAMAVNQVRISPQR